MITLFVDTVGDSPLLPRMTSTALTHPSDALLAAGDVALFPSCVNGKLADALANNDIPVVGSSRTAELLPAVGETMRIALRAFNFPLANINGISFMLTVWWNGHTSQYPTLTLSDFEPLADGTIQQVGLSSTVVRREGPILSTLGLPISELMSRQTYRGPIHIFCRANSDRLSVEGIGFGLDNLVTFTMLELWGLTPNELIELLVTGEQEKAPRAEVAIAIAVRGNQPIESTYPQVWTLPLGAIVVARGSGYGQAARRVYRTIANIEQPITFSQAVGASSGNLLNRLRWWL